MKEPLIHQSAGDSYRRSGQNRSYILNNILFMPSLNTCTISEHLSVLSFKAIHCGFESKIAFCWFLSLSSVVLKAPGIPVSSNEQFSPIILAIPFEARSIKGMPWPLKPAHINWFSFPGTAPICGTRSEVYYSKVSQMPLIHPLFSSKVTGSENITQHLHP